MFSGVEQVKTSGSKREVGLSQHFTSRGAQLSRRRGHHAPRPVGHIHPHSCSRRLARRAITMCCHKSTASSCSTPRYSISRPGIASTCSSFPHICRTTTALPSPDTSAATASCLSLLCVLSLPLPLVFLLCPHHRLPCLCGCSWRTHWTSGPPRGI